jgi:hypothetical protein
VLEIRHGDWRRNAAVRAGIAIAAQQLAITTVGKVAMRFNRSDSALSHKIRLSLKLVAVQSDNSITQHRHSNPSRLVFISV